MKIRFRKGVSTERGNFPAGHVVVVKALPRGWDAWLTQSLIEIEPDFDQMEVAVAREQSRTAVMPRPKRSRKRGPAAVA